MNRYKHIVIATFAAYILKLSLTKTIIFYVHPRYVFLTTAAATIALLVNIYGALKSEKVKKLTLFELAKDIGILCIICLGFALEPQALSTSFAQQRDIETDLSLQQSAVEDLELDFDNTLDFEAVLIRSRFGGDETSKGEEVDVSGFVQFKDTLPEQAFMLTRYVITCCAVDARPFGVVVLREDSTNLREGSWVEVKGKVIKTTIDDQEMVAVQGEVTETKEEIKNPYSY